MFPRLLPEISPLVIHSFKLCPQPAPCWDGNGFVPTCNTFVTSFPSIRKEQTEEVSLAFADLTRCGPAQTARQRASHGPQTAGPVGAVRHEQGLGAGSRDPRHKPADNHDLE